MKNMRLNQITKGFVETVLPSLKTNKYNYFKSKKLNNANLLPYQTYLMDLTDFEKIHKKMNSSFDKTLNYLKNLEKVGKPVEKLKKDANTI